MDDLTAEAIKRLIGAGIGAAGLGVVTRGALGAVRSLSAPPPEPALQQRIVVPIPVLKSKNKNKTTSFVAGGPPVGGLPGLPGEDKVGGVSVPTVGDNNWYLPALAAVTLPSMYLGYKGMDSYLNNREKNNMASQLDAARKRFRATLVESLGPVPAQPKLAVDMLAVNREKVGNMLGMLGAGGVIASLLSAKLMYDAASSRSPSAVLAAAEKRRQRETAARTPPSIELQPTPVSIGRGGSVHVINPEALGNNSGIS